MMWLPLLLLWSSLALSNSLMAVEVRKCCDTDSMLVQTSLGTRKCENRKEILTKTKTKLPKWTPIFHDFQSKTEVSRPNSYVLHVGMPECTMNTKAFPVYHHHLTDDEMMLLQNGSLVHRLVHNQDLQTEFREYDAQHYCVEDLLVRHDKGFNEGNYEGDNEGNNEISNEGSNNDQDEADVKDEVYEFAYICVTPHHQMSLQRLMDEVVYPLGLLISVLCVMLTFLLYAFLPQLRDLTGKFILAICFCLACVFVLRLLNVFAWTHPALNRLVSDFLLHTSLLCLWLSLSCMGHHVWQIIRSRSVFTRVTDGRRLLYYSLFVLLATLIILALALVLEMSFDKDNLKMGHVSKAAFVLNSCLCFLINWAFYCTAYRIVRREMRYNRAMQHFQVNFDLFTKLLMVLSGWWLLSLPSLLLSSSTSPLLSYSSKLLDAFLGPLIFCATMCRSRVFFLFKRHFCLDCCCKEPELIEHQKPYELSIINDRNNDNKEEQDNLLKDEYGMMSSKSLFNVRAVNDVGAVQAPDDPDQPLGRVKRLLKSNSLNAVANVNFGWRKETAV